MGSDRDLSSRSSSSSSYSSSPSRYDERVNRRRRSSRSRSKDRQHRGGDSQYHRHYRKRCRRDNQKKKKEKPNRSQSEHECPEPITQNNESMKKNSHQSPSFSDDSSYSSVSSDSRDRKRRKDHHRRRSKKRKREKRRKSAKQRKESKKKRKRKLGRSDKDSESAIDATNCLLTSAGQESQHGRTSKKKKSPNPEANQGIIRAANDPTIRLTPPDETPGTEKDADLEESERRERRRAMMVPMSRQQYEKEQSVIREVYDEQSGRWRLVRGSGEIIERIVSRDDHQRINQRATQGDGESFSKSIYGALSKKTHR